MFLSCLLRSVLADANGFRGSREDLRGFSPVETKPLQEIRLRDKVFVPQIGLSQTHQRERASNDS